MTLEAILLLAGLLLALTWVVYPLALSFFRISRTEPPAPQDPVPARTPVTALVAAWNAEKEIGQRVRNLAAQSWPPEHLKILIASDGSTDRTVEVALHAAPGRAAAKPFPRGGKSSTQNLAMREISDEIVVLSDADTEFAPDCIEHLLAPFSDPAVGCVTGTMISRDAARPLSKDQGLYWRFENWLRLCESDCGILVTAAGACMAFRRKLWVPLPPSRGDDCMIPLDVALAGYKVVHAPRALAYDFFPSTLRGELRARRRMTARNIGGIFDRPQLLNPLRYPGYALSLWLHKIFRWMTPFFALGLFLPSVALPLRHPVLLALELLFLLLASLGAFFAMRAKPAPRLAAAAFSFLLANLGFALGVIRWLRRQEITTYSNISDATPPQPGARSESLPSR